MGKESFEDKIRQQLEGYEAPYDKSYWKKYVRSYPAPQMVFWKAWWMPYVFSSLLFGTAWFWFGRDAQPASTAEVLRDTVVVQQTIVTRDTLVVRDTVVLVWRSDNRQQQHAENKLRAVEGDGAASGQQQIIDDRPRQQAGNKLRSVEGGSVGAEFQQKTVDKQQLTTDSLQHAAEHQTLNANGQPLNADSQPQNADSQKATPEEMAAQMDSIELAALAEIPTEPESKLQDAGFFVSAGPRLTVFSPLNYGNFDTRFGNFVGGAVQMEWRKWQLEAGLQYGLQLNELDDLTRVPLSQRQQFPGYSSLTAEPDEVGVISEHLLVPLQLRFTVYDYRGWRVQVAGGALGNVVLGETFVYDKENVDRDRWERTVAGRGGLSLSHLNAGIGTSYQWRQNLELQAILNYYHPLRPLGLNRLEAGALSLQLGLNWLLLPR